MAGVAQHYNYLRSLKIVVDRRAASEGAPEATGPVSPSAAPELRAEPPADKRPECLRFAPPSRWCAPVGRAPCPSWPSPLAARPRGCRAGDWQCPMRRDRAHDRHSDRFLEGRYRHHERRPTAAPFVPPGIVDVDFYDSSFLDVQRISRPRGLRQGTRIAGQRRFRLR